MHNSPIVRYNTNVISNRLAKLLEKSGLDIKDNDFENKFDAYLEPLLKPAEAVKIIVD
jgi:hypothetical protein